MLVKPTRSLRLVEIGLRLILPLVLGLSLYAFVWIGGQFEPEQFSWASLFVLIGQVYVLFEGARWLLRRLDRWLPWEAGFGRRLIWQLLAAICFALIFVLTLYVPLKLWMIYVQQQRDAVSIVHLSYVGALVLFAILFISFVQFSLRFFERWQHSEIDAERWQRESAEARLLVLQNQLDPHFLFNSLNLVYGLIGEQPRQAEKLLLTLSEVLRFALAHGDRELVTLTEEMAFADAWAALLLARHGSALVVERRIAAAALSRRLPPYSVQLLLENAVKHNALDPAAPLHVVIEADGDHVAVHHMRRPRREPVSGHGRGLTSIAGRYRLLGAEAPRIECDTEFRVVLPLLDQR